MAFYTTGLFASGTGPVLEYGDPQLEYHGTYRSIQYKPGAADVPYCYSEDDDWSVNKYFQHVQNYVLAESYILPSPAWTQSEADRAAANNAIKEQLYAGRAVTTGVRGDHAVPNQEQTSHYINTENWAHYTYEKIGSDHEVCIIGWDDNYPRENFAHRVEGMDDAEAYALTTPAHDGAWLVKNSWGSQENEFPNKGKGWGLYQGQDRGVLDPETGKYEYKAREGAVQTGYFWLSYEDASVDRPETFSFDSATAMEGYFLYQYDFMPVLEVNSQYFSAEVSMGNLFTAKVPGVLDAVSCQTTVPGTQVTYEVYLLEDQDIDLKEPAARAEGVYEYGGFHREKLETPVLLKEGQEFLVLVTQAVPNDTGDMYCVSTQLIENEKAMEGSEEGTNYGKGIINEEESLFFLCYGDDVFILDLSNKDFQDELKPDWLDKELYDMDNFPIKAYVASLSPAANWLTYTGQAQELIIPSSVTLEGYTPQYSTDDGETWSAEIPVGTNVGSYTVETRYVNKDNDSDVISAGPVTAFIDGIPVVITAKDQTIRIGDDPAWNADSYTVETLEGVTVTLAKEPDVRYMVYDKDEKTGAVAEVSKDTVMDYNIVPCGAVLDVEDPGIYEIYYQPGILTVQGVPVTVKARDVTVYVGDTVPKWTADSYTVEGLDEGDALSVKVSGKYYTLSGYAKKADEIDTGKTGKYYITPSGDRVDGKYVISYKDGALTVAERPEPSGSGGGGGATANPVTVPASSAATGGTVTSSAANATRAQIATMFQRFAEVTAE